MHSKLLALWGVLALVVVDEVGLKSLLLNFGALALRPNIQPCQIGFLLLSFDSLHIIADRILALDKLDENLCDFCEISRRDLA
jgi:hypothetical protein